MKSTIFICQLPSDVQLAISVKIRDYLYEEFGTTISAEEMDRRVDDAMSGRLCDVEDAVPLEEVEQMML